MKIIANHAIFSADIYLPEQQRIDKGKKQNNNKKAQQNTLQASNEIRHVIWGTVNFYILLVVGNSFVKFLMRKSQ